MSSTSVNRHRRHRPTDIDDVDSEVVKQALMTHRHLSWMFCCFFHSFNPKVKVLKIFSFHIFYVLYYFFITLYFNNLSIKPKTAQPNLIVYNRNSIRLSGEKQKTGTYFPQMIFTTRAAIVYNFNARYFAGSTFLFNTTTLCNRNHYTDIMQWRARAFVGVRL